MPQMSTLYKRHHFVHWFFHALTFIVQSAVEDIFLLLKTEAIL